MMGVGSSVLCCFFFQAEDGIRDPLVTGVQTCALPISCARSGRIKSGMLRNFLNCGRWDYIFSAIKKFRNIPDFILPDRAQVTMTTHFMRSYSLLAIKTCHRSEERRVGKECKSRWPAI